MMQGASESEIFCFPSIRKLPSLFEWLCSIMECLYIHINTFSIL